MPGIQKTLDSDRDEEDASLTLTASKRCVPVGRGVEVIRVFSSPSRLVFTSPASAQKQLTAYLLQVPVRDFPSKKSIFGIEKMKRILDKVFPREYIASSWRRDAHSLRRLAMSAMGCGRVGVSWSVAERARCRCLGWSSAGVAWFHLQSATGAGVCESMASRNVLASS